MPAPAKDMILIQFEALGLSPAILKSIAALGYETPTPIQEKAIPSLLEGRDLMGLAQTGTGKTAAFGLPLVQKLSEDRSRPAPRSTRALILAPTRELANQIADNLRSYVKRMQMRVAIVVGGASMRNQIRELERGVDILVATPGRLLDHIESKTVNIGTAKFLVLDEADQMLDLGFIHALRTIARMVGTPRQTMLFSATMPKQIEALSRTFLTDPVRVEATPAGSTAERVNQSVHFVQQAGKAAVLTEMLKRDEKNLSLVFSRTKHGAEKLLKQLLAAGLTATSIHGNKSQGQRERAIRQFRSGEVRVLVATDVAARGIDIPGVSHVYNFDLPQVAESYVHRIGRTARAGASGEAISLCAPDENSLLRSIERLTNIPMERLNAPAGRSQGRASGAEFEPVEMGARRGNGRGDAPRGGNGNGGRRNGPHQGAPRHEGQGEGRRAGGGRNGNGSGARFGSPDAAAPAAKTGEKRQGKQFAHRASAPAGAPGDKRRNRRPGRRAAGF